MFGHFCGLDNVHIFVCVQTWLQSGLVFILIHENHILVLVWCGCSVKLFNMKHQGSPDITGQFHLSEDFFLFLIKTLSIIIDTCIFCLYLISE